jgi:ketosteroid isomerase-like protein
MSQEHVAVISRIYEAWATGDFRAGADHLDQNVVFVVGSDFPTFGVFLGLAGVRKYMQDFLDQWEEFTIEAKHIEAVGDTVLAQVVQHGRGRASGVEVDVTHFMLFTFRGKKIVRIESIMSEGEAFAAAGLSE